MRCGPCQRWERLRVVFDPVPTLPPRGCRFRKTLLLCSNSKTPRPWTAWENRHPHTHTSDDRGIKSFSVRCGRAYLVCTLPRFRPYHIIYLVCRVWDDIGNPAPSPLVIVNAGEDSVGVDHTTFVDPPRGLSSEPSKHLLILWNIHMHKHLERVSLASYTSPVGGLLFR